MKISNVIVGKYIQLIGKGYHRIKTMCNDKQLTVIHNRPMHCTEKMIELVMTKTSRVYE